MKALYVHIPFCESICSYCNYCKRVPKDALMIDNYINTLKKEKEKVKGPFTTIYIGGGTPSMLNKQQLKSLLSIFENEQPSEYTIEINPESYTIDKGKVLKEYNVNRVSLGVQTFNNEHLKKLNRLHTNEQVFKTISSLNSLGINNISIDLIFGIPSQTKEDLLNDLKIATSLNVTHISYYELSIEEKTLFHLLYQKGLLEPISSDLQVEMYETVISNLKENGFHQYEVSNYAKAIKYESLHNKIYWSLYPYEGLGAGSHGFDGSYRYYHSENVSEYIKEPKVIKEFQTEDVLYADYLIFGLRMMQGVSLERIKSLFNRNPLEDFKELNTFIKDGLLVVEDNHLKPTLKGTFLLNKIVEVFV